MTTVDQFLKALAMVESSDNPEAWGDSGRAMGRWQVHPDRLVTDAGRFKIWPMIGRTWDQWVAELLRANWQLFYPDHSPVQIAMHWHLGHMTAPTNSDWDAKYAIRFNAALADAERE